MYVDPDNLNRATVVLPMHSEPVEVDLQITAFADMTLPEVLQLMAEMRREAFGGSKHGDLVGMRRAGEPGRADHARTGEDSARRLKTGLGGRVTLFQLFSKPIALISSYRRRRACMTWSS